MTADNQDGTDCHGPSFGVGDYHTPIAMERTVDENEKTASSTERVVEITSSISSMSRHRRTSNEQRRHVSSTLCLR